MAPWGSFVIDVFLEFDVASLTSARAQCRASWNRRSSARSCAVALGKKVDERRKGAKGVTAGPSLNIFLGL